MNFLFYKFVLKIFKNQNNAYNFPFKKWKVKNVIFSDEQF